MAGAVAFVVETVRTELPDPPEETGTLDGSRLRLGPAGVTVACKLTVPVKLLTLVTVTVDVPEEPAVMVRLLGLALRSKSGVVFAAWTASAMTSQYQFAPSPNVTGKLVAGELTTSYSETMYPPSPFIRVNPDPALSTGKVLCSATPSIMSLGLLVDIREAGVPL